MILLAFLNFSVTHQGQKKALAESKAHDSKVVCTNKREVYKYNNTH